MVHRSLEALKLDQRLIRRRGWITGDELQRALSGLPDVADKIDRSEPEPEPEPRRGRADGGESP